MKTAAVICEYNPFHLGHARQIRCIREVLGEDTVILALMSGNYVQRGEAAIADKYDRAECAVACGVNAVIELPYPWSCSAAPFFARGAVDILNAMGGVDCLVFGCEEMTQAELALYAERIGSAEYLCAVKELRKEAGGEISDIRLRQTVYESLYGDPVPQKPNDILAAEYLLSLRQTHSAIEPLAIARKGEWSATAIRQAILRGEVCEDMIPPEAYAVLQRACVTDHGRFSDAMMGYLRLSPHERYAGCDGATGGFARRIEAAAQKSADSQELLAFLRCKSHTDAAIRRTVLHCLFGTRREDLRKAPAYSVLLAADTRGTAYLRKAAKQGSMPVLTKPSAYKKLGGSALAQGELRARADGFFAVSQGKTGADPLRRTPYIRKEQL